MSLSAFPVPHKYVSQYGRGRTYFPSAVEFTMPLLCAVRIPNESTLFYYIFDILEDWENWKLAMPASADNNVLCYADPLDAKGKPIGTRRIENGYNWCTIAELRRRLSLFWRNSVVSMRTTDGSLTWIPMECADPFNLLGFTCLPVIRSVSIASLPLWKAYDDALAVATLKPVYVDQLPRNICYSDVPDTTKTSAPAKVPQVIKEPISAAFDTPAISESVLSHNPSIAAMRDYLRYHLDQKRPTDIWILEITEVYNMNAQNIAYLCLVRNFDRPIWISEHLLECLEINDMPAYRKYQVALFAFQKRLDELAAKEFI